MFFHHRLRATEECRRPRWDRRTLLRHQARVPLAEPGALGIGPLEVANGVAYAANLLGYLKVVDQRHKLI
jgi:hypothetical protein